MEIKVQSRLVDNSAQVMWNYIDIKVACSVDSPIYTPVVPGLSDTRYKKAP